MMLRLPFHRLCLQVQLVRILEQSLAVAVLGKSLCQSPGARAAISRFSFADMSLVIGADFQSSGLIPSETNVGTRIRPIGGME
jgi:hypothetical protein